MPCVRPIHGHWGPGGRVYFDGTGWRDRPVSLACGKCVGCRNARAQSWALRCQHEASQHAHNAFVTLTYSTASLPKDLSLNPGDFLDFIRRLKRAKGKLRYFHCGEYGDENKRPHYHALIFGVDFPDRVLLKSSGKGFLYQSQELSETWGLGYCTVGDVSFQSAAYVARYCMKKQRADARCYERFNPDTGEVWSVRPEYCTMSRRPGIGASWFERYSSDVFPSDEVVFEGRKYRPPRYYEQLLKRSDEKALDAVKSRRVDWLLSHPDATHPDRLEAKEYVLESNFTNRLV